MNDGIQDKSKGREMILMLSSDTETPYRGVPAGIQITELEPERPDEFSTSPYEFEESALILWDDTQLTWHHACTANRFSEQYLIFSARLEKNIRQVGSYCLTKAVLEQKGMSFPSLSGLSVSELIGMVSFHLRKAHAAFRGLYNDNHVLGMAYLDWEFRWVALGERLKLTAEKIEKIAQGKISADSLLKKPEPAAEQPSPPVPQPKPLRVSPGALPIKGSVAREIAEAQRAEEARQRKIEKLVREAHKTLNSDSVSDWGLASVFMSEFREEPRTDPLRPNMSYEEAKQESERMRKELENPGLGFSDESDDEDDGKYSAFPPLFGLDPDEIFGDGPARPP